MTGLCIYHGGCTDGVASAWAVHDVHPDWTFYPGVYSNPPPMDLIAAASEVWLVDFSYKRPSMEALNAHCRCAVGVLDHHASAERELQPLLDDGILLGEFDMHRCGALMAWDWFHDGAQRPELLAYIDARDRWQQDATLELNLDHVIMALRSYPHTDPIDFGLWDTLMFLDGAAGLAGQGAHIHRYYRMLVDAAKRDVRRVDIAGYRDVPSVNARYELASELAGELAAEADCGWAFCWWQRADGDYVASLRSRGDVDVSKIAEQYGGGGHPGAAGFTCHLRPWGAKL